MYMYNIGTYTRLTAPRECIYLYLYKKSFVRWSKTCNRNEIKSFFCTIICSILFWILFFYVSIIKSVFIHLYLCPNKIKINSNKTKDPCCFALKHDILVRVSSISTNNKYNGWERRAGCGGSGRAVLSLHSRTQKINKT